MSQIIEAPIGTLVELPSYSNELPPDLYTNAIASILWIWKGRGNEVMVTFSSFRGMLRGRVVVGISTIKQCFSQAQDT
jgi:hypothetical protein